MWELRVLHSSFTKEHQVMVLQHADNQIWMAQGARNTTKHVEQLKQKKFSLMMEDDSDMFAFSGINISCDKGTIELTQEGPLKRSCVTMGHKIPRARTLQSLLIPLVLTRTVTHSTTNGAILQQSECSFTCRPTLDQTCNSLFMNVLGSHMIRSNPMDKQSNTFVVVWQERVTRASSSLQI